VNASYELPVRLGVVGYWQSAFPVVADLGVGDPKIIAELGHLPDPAM
jgi:hypothetical protein